MEYDPLSDVQDEPLSLTPDVMTQLTSLRDTERFEELPGVDTALERERLSALFQNLLDRLLAGLLKNPRKRWVMEQFQPVLVAMQDEDTEAREHFGISLERIMDIVGIESSDGMLSHYLG
jgi:hypothetical protein